MILENSSCVTSVLEIKNSLTETASLIPVLESVVSKLVPGMVSKPLGAEQMGRTYPHNRSKPRYCKGIMRSLHMKIFPRVGYSLHKPSVLYRSSTGISRLP